MALKGSTFKHKKETKLKIKLNNAKYWKGKNRSEETKDKISKTKKGKKLSDHHKKKIGKGLKSAYSTGKRSAWNKGKSTSFETIEKRVNSRKGYTHSKNTRKKISKANTGRKLTDSHKQKLSFLHKAENLSIESRILYRNHRLTQIFPKKDTKPEKMFQLALDLQQLKYEKHKAVIGQPDVFIEPNICIFIDGDFWHANPSLYKANDMMYGKKIAAEIWAYDRMINDELTKQGYLVLRIWESTIKESNNSEMNSIMNMIKERIKNW